MELADLRRQYKIAYNEGSPSHLIRRLVQDSITWANDEPSTRGDKLDEIIDCIDPSTYVGEDGIWVREKAGRLLVTRGREQLDLGDLCAKSADGDYETGKVDHVWIDTRSQRILDVHRFLMGVPHLVSPQLHISIGKNLFSEGHLDKVGNGGHCYLRNLTIDGISDPERKWERGRIGPVLQRAGEGGQFYGKRLALEDVACALAGVGSQRGRATIDGLRISQHTPGPYSLGSAAANKGKLTLLGELCAHQLLQACGIAGGKVIVDTPGMLHVQHPANLTAICGSLHGQLGHLHGSSEYFCTSSHDAKPRGFLGIIVPTGPDDAEILHPSEVDDPEGYRTWPVAAPRGLERTYQLFEVGADLLGELAGRPTYEKLARLREQMR